jgi:RNA polymerase sigma factor (sigma-70 family)
MMTPREYLSQAYRLKDRIRALSEEIKNMKELAASVSSPGFDEHYNPNRPQEAPFVKALERISDYEEKLSDRIARLVRLEDEIDSVIEQVIDPDERMVLHYRYINNFTWERIGDLMNADRHTVRRWHERALNHVKVPEDTAAEGE